MTTLDLSTRLREVEQLRRLWLHVLGVDAPSPQQFAYWTRYHSPEVVRQAIEKTSGRALRGRPMDLDFKVRYVSRICNQLTFSEYERAKKSSSSECDALKQSSA